MASKPVECERLLGEYRARGMILDECQLSGNVSLHMYDAVNNLQRGIERYPFELKQATCVA